MLLWNTSFSQAEVRRINTRVVKCNLMACNTREVRPDDLMVPLALESRDNHVRSKCTGQSNEMSQECAWQSLPGLLCFKINKYGTFFFSFVPVHLLILFLHRKVFCG